MTLSGNIWVLTKLANLAQRCGVSPTVMSFDLNFIDDFNHKDLYRLSYVDICGRNDQEQAGMGKALELLGFNKSGEELTFPDLSSVEEAVDRALALAPRARSR